MMSKLVVLIFFLFGVSQSEFVLNSVPLTEKGDWKDWERCPPYTYVIAMDVTFDSKGSILDGDHLGLFDIVFQCSEFIEPVTSEFIFSKVGGVSHRITGSPKINSSLDDYEVTYDLPLRSRCNGVAVGFELNSLEEQGTRDNLGAANFRLHCSNLRSNSPSFVEAYGGNLGSWTGSQHCPARHAICGIQTQSLDIDQPAADHIAIENIRVLCCEVPNPASICEPTHEWTTVDLFEPISTTTAPRFINYTRSTGVNVISRNKDEHVNYMWFNSIGYDARDDDQDWITSALMENSHKLDDLPPVDGGYTWSESPLRTWMKQTPPEVMALKTVENERVKIYQLVARCAYFIARTGRFKMQKMSTVEYAGI